MSRPTELVDVRLRLPSVECTDSFLPLPVFYVSLKEQEIIPLSHNFQSKVRYSLAGLYPTFTFATSTEGIVPGLRSAYTRGPSLGDCTLAVSQPAPSLFC